VPLPFGGDTVDQLKATVPAPAVAVGAPGALRVPRVAAACPEPVAVKKAVAATTVSTSASGAAPARTRSPFLKAKDAVSPAPDEPLLEGRPDIGLLIAEAQPVRARLHDRRLD
jgi:hypothetical protein